MDTVRRHALFVDSKDLTPAQIHRLMTVVYHHHKWLENLNARMKGRAFPIHDPIYNAARQARESMLKLYSEIDSLNPNVKQIVHAQQDLHD